MPDPIVARILQVPGYGVYQHVFDEATQTVTCWLRPSAPTPYDCCPGCGISTQATVGSPTERRVRDRSSRSSSTRSRAAASRPHDCTVIARFLGRAERTGRRRVSPRQR